MHILRWSNISPNGEAIHVAFVEGSLKNPWVSHGHDFYEVFLVDSGRATHFVGRAARPVPLLAGQVVFIRAGDFHGFRAEPSAEPFAIINVAFSRSAWSGLRDHYQLAAQAVFNEESEEPPVQELAGELRREVAGQFRDLLHEPRSALVRDGFLLGLARKLGDASPIPGLARAPAWLRKGLMHSLREPATWQDGVAGLARRSGCSSGHLARTMQKILGLSPSEWLMQIRLRRAAQLLESTGFSVADVALESGFENLSHFHRCFLGAYGQTPLRYRRERLKEVV